MRVSEPIPFLTDSISIPNYSMWSTAKLIWIGVVLLISLFSFVELFNWLYKKSISSRKSFIIILFYFILTLLIALYGTNESCYFLLSPLSVIIANYFTYTKARKIANILFLLLLIFSVSYKYLITI